MNKIDKILYGGFAVFVLAGLAVMLVSIFSPPKPVVEETVETPMPSQIEQPTPEPVVAVETTQPENKYVDYYLDDAGNRVWLTAEDIAESGAIKAEFKRQEEEQKSLEKAKKEWWESRKDWVERFPFKPTPHPEITFDPDAFRANREMRDLARNHSLLKGLYESWVPYTEEFEQMYDIVKEELGEMESTAVLAKTFRTLTKYHKAAQKDPDAIYRENVRVELPAPEPVNTMVALGPEFYILSKEKQNEIINELTDAQIEAMRANNTQKYEVRDVTWAEEVEMC